MRHNVLIDLDCLLDTRLGTLSKHCPESIGEVILNGYFTRPNDRLGNLTDKFTNEEYKAWYDKRDVETLKHSRLSSYIYELADTVTELGTYIYDDNNRIKEGSVIINVYPYNLDDDTCADIVYAIEQHCTDLVDIKIGNFPIDQLGLKQLKDLEILTYVPYSFADWMQSNFTIEKGKDTIWYSYPKLQVYTPKIMDRLEALENLTTDDKAKLKDTDIFGLISLFFAPFFGLRFIPIELVSLVNKDILQG